MCYGHLIGPTILSAPSQPTEQPEPFLYRVFGHSGDADSHRCHPGCLLLQGGQLLCTNSENGKPLSVIVCCNIIEVHLRLS